MIGEPLLGLRKDARLTQQELADILSINVHSISSYERDKSEPPDAIKIQMATFFGVSVDYLVGITGRPHPYREESTYVPLPPDFPKDSLPELYDFMEFQTYKAKKKRNRRTENSVSEKNASDNEWETEDTCLPSDNVPSKT